MQSGWNNPAFAGDEVGDRAVSRRKLKPTFRTQAGALMRKNLVFQKRNWKTNCCLVVSPVIFSVVLAIIQIAINTVFDSEQFKCGCQCKAYKGGNETFTLAAYGKDNGAGILMWPNRVTGIYGISYNIPSDDVTCQERDTTRCGVQYSEPRSITWCPIPSPLRTPPVIPVPFTDMRADVSGLDYSTLDNATDIEADGDDQVTHSGYNIPITVLYTGNDKGFADALGGLLTGGASAQKVVRTFVNNAGGLGAALGKVDMSYRDLSKLSYISTFMQALAGDNFTALFNASSNPADTNPSFSLIGGVPLMGSARRAPPILQTDSAFNPGQSSYYILPRGGCTSAEIGAIVPYNTLLAIFAILQGGGFAARSGSAAVNTTAGAPPPPPVCGIPASIFASIPAALATGNATALTAFAATVTVKQAICLTGLLTQGTPFQCVEAQTTFVNSSAEINFRLFTGYGRGTPAEQGTDKPMDPNAIQQYAFAVDFQDTNYNIQNAKLSTNIWHNNTNLLTTQGPIRYRRLPAVLNSITNSFLNILLNNGQVPASPAPAARARLLYLRDMPKVGSQLSLDFSSFLGPLFYTWLSQMLLPVMVGLLVYEKEKNLRVMMKMQGLSDGSYWIINYAYYFVIHLCFQLLIWIFGAGLQIKMFLLTQPGVIILFYILFTNVQIAIAFLFNSIFSNAKAASVVTVVYVILTGLLGEFLFKPYVESDDFPRRSIFGLMIIVPFSLYRGYYEMAAEAFVGNYVGLQGLTFSKLSSIPQGMATVYAIFIVEWVILLIAAYYLEQVLNTGSGVKRHPLFFLDCILKRSKGAGAAGGVVEHGAVAAAGAEDGATPTDEPDDVRRERDYAEHGADRATTPIIAYRLGKTYAGRDGGPPKVACKDFSLAIPKGEVFGLLGPNGAGKSTSINMLIGFLTPSHGTAFIEGLDISQDMDTIYTLLGVCPQHDLIWETLTAREHLMFYGRLKNLRGKELQQAVDEALQSVNLFANNVGDKQVGGYSGGMKRRLSVAISFIGNPLVVFLDEPSTGLDPASRQQLWGVIKAAKRDRAMVLTTHSMEEAEELCDRLGIFVDGALQCIGNPKELTNRYGGFLILTITTSPELAEEVKRFVQRELSKRATCSYAVGGIQKFDVPADETDIASIFRKVEANKGKLRIIDWGVANMTLEEVFIKISRHIGAQTNDF